MDLALWVPPIVGLGLAGKVFLFIKALGRTALGYKACKGVGGGGVLDDPNPRAPTPSSQALLQDSALNLSCHLPLMEGKRDFPRVCREFAAFTAVKSFPKGNETKIGEPLLGGGEGDSGDFGRA